MTVTISVPKPTKLRETIGTGFGYETIGGQVIRCANLDKKGYGYTIYMADWGGRPSVYVYEYTPHYSGPLNSKYYYVKNGKVYIKARDGRYSCTLTEYNHWKDTAEVREGQIVLKLGKWKVAYIRGGEGKGYLIKVYPSGKVVYYTKDCKYAKASATPRNVAVKGDEIIIPVAGLDFKTPTGQLGVYDHCYFDWADGTVEVIYVTWETKDLGIQPAEEKPEEQPAPQPETGPQEQPKEEEQPAPQPQPETKPQEQYVPPKLAPSPAREMSGHVVGATVEDDLVKVSVSVTSDGIGTAVAEITYSKDGAPIKTQKVPFQVAAGQNTKVLVSKMPFCGSFEMTVKLTDQNGNLIGPIWKAAVQCRKATVTPMSVEEKPAGEAEEPGAPKPVEKLPVEAGEEGGKIPGWLIALAIAAGILAMKGGD